MILVLEPLWCFCPSWILMDVIIHMNCCRMEKSYVNDF